MLKRMLWTGILNYKLKGKLSLYVIMGEGKEEVSLLVFTLILAIECLAENQLCKSVCGDSHGMLRTNVLEYSIFNSVCHCCFVFVGFFFSYCGSGGFI